MFELLPIDNSSTTTPYVYEYVITAKDKKEEQQQWNIPVRSIAKKHLETMSKKELDQDWKLDELFGLVYTINLPHSTLRLQKMAEEFQNIGVKSFNVFNAIDGRKEVEEEIWRKFYLNLHSIDTTTEEGKHAMDLLHQSQAGCYLSHLNLIKHVKNCFDAAQKKYKLAKKNNDSKALKEAKRELSKYRSVVIFEDDSGFGFLKNADLTVSKAGVGKHLRQALMNLPDDWDMVYLVVNATKPTKKISSNLRKLHLSWCQNAYAVNHTMYGPIIERLNKIHDPAVTKLWPVDNEIAELHPFHNVYAIYPSVVYAQDGKSHITDTTWDKWQGQPIFPIEEKK